MLRRLSFLLPLLLLCVLLTPSQPAFARFNSLPDLLGFGKGFETDSSWPVNAFATCATVTVELSYPKNEDPIPEMPQPYDSVTWSLEKVLVNGTQEVQISDADKTIYTFPFGTTGGETRSKTFNLAEPLEAGTGLFIKVRYYVNGGDLDTQTDVFDVGDFNHPYWHIRAYEPTYSMGNTQHFCADNNNAPTLHMLGDVVQKEGNGGMQTYPYTLFLSKPTDKPVRIDIESWRSVGLPTYNPPFPSFNGYSTRGIKYGDRYCEDQGPSCTTPTYTTITIPAGETRVTLDAKWGSDSIPEKYWYELENNSIPVNIEVVRVANAKFGGKVSARLLARNDDGCRPDSPPGQCLIDLIVPGGYETYPIEEDKYSFTVSNQQVDETAGSVTFTVNLTTSTPEVVQLQYETTSEGYNAVAGEDYTATSGILVFPANTLTKDITVPIIISPQAEGLEAFGMKVWKIGSVQNADTAVVGALIINDYAAPPTATPPPTSTGEATPEPTSTATAEITSQGVELLLNGDFELKNANQKPQLSPWTLKNASRDKIKCNKETKIVAITGDCALMLRGVAGEKTNLMQKVALETLTFEENDKLVFTAHINAKAAARGKIKIRVKYMDDTLETGRIDLDLRQTDQYEVFTGELTLLRDDIKSIRLIINHRTPSGKVFIDTLSLKQRTSESVLLPLP